MPHFSVGGSLQEVIDRLEQEPDKTRIIKHGFSTPHAYRGFYEDVAFYPAENVTIQSMLEAATAALGETFTGYKGGDYKMEPHTDCWLAEYGHTGSAMSALLLEFMLKEA